MPEIIRSKVEGVSELDAALSGLGTEVATKIGVRANRKAAQEFRDLLKATAPYDPRPKTSNGKARPYGHLRDNIKVVRKKARVQGNIVFWVTIGRAFWGFFVEKGTSRMRAQPWMLPAFNVAKERLGRVQIDELKDGIERAAKRLAKIKRSG